MADMETSTTESTGANDNETKTFTQEEVDRIVQDRLARERKKYEVPTPDPLAEREKELNARETKLNIKELINGEGYPKELANTLKYNSFEEFKDQVESLKEMGLLNTVSTKASYRVSTSTKQGNGSSNSFCTTEDEDIRKAMKLR